MTPPTPVEHVEGSSSPADLSGTDPDETHRYLQTARSVLGHEACALGELAKRLDASFVRAVDLIAELRGHLVVTGLGKSGLVGRRMAATLASTGTPAFFVHAGDALHGDAGMIESGDVLLAISNSGETLEVCRLVEVLRERDVRIIAVTGSGHSTLSRLADVVVDAHVDTEADPFNLVPTASAITVAALGDALAITLMVQRRFGPSDFARHHPGGSLGRRLSDPHPSEVAGD